MNRAIAIHSPTGLWGEAGSVLSALKGEYTIFQIRFIPIQHQVGALITPDNMALKFHKSKQNHQFL
jgi:hypothetical protein